VPPSIEDGATVVAATVGSRTLLSCDTIGLPRPQVRWEKDGRVIRQAGARHVMSRRGSLQLNDVQVSDTGTYRCVAENSAGTVSRDIQLLVHGIQQRHIELLGHDFDLSGSRDVIDDVIIRSAMGHFLLVGNWYEVSNSNRFRDICI